MSEKMEKLSPEQLEQISGGYIVSDENNNKYYLVKQDGTVLLPAPSKEKALEYAREYDTINSQLMTVEEYKKHFGRDFEW